MDGARTRSWATITDLPKHWVDAQLAFKNALDRTMGRTLSLHLCDLFVQSLTLAVLPDRQLHEWMTTDSVCC